MRSFSTPLGALLLSLAAFPAMAALSSEDRTFVTKAAVGGQAEVAFGQLAKQNASSPAVKQFGERMVTDHTQANEELMQIARSQNLDVPKGLDAKHQAKEQQFSTTKGAAFDKAYMQDMVQDHKEDIADFRKEAEHGQDPQLKAFAAKYLPILEEHLQLAQSVAAK
jgi:putative membrane protein